MLTYRDSEWAVRRWDWFNGGRVVEPLSFCQFWRTVLVWATLKVLFLPLIWLSALVNAIPVPNLTLPTPPRQLVYAPLKGCWLLMGLCLRILWFLAHPLRLAAKPIGRGALAGAVGAGERVGTFYGYHRAEMEAVGTALIILLVAVVFIFYLLLAFLASWFWTLIGIASGIGILTIGGFTIYGVAKSGVLGLLWQAGVATHHGICPPVRIVRG